MTIELDHTIVPSRTRSRGAGSWRAARRAVGALGPRPFAPVYVNEGLTIDFIDTDEAFPVYHYCFRVQPADFAAILERIRAAEIPFRSDVHGPVDMQVHPEYGNVYWNVPDGHMWEMLTVSYARPPT